MYPGGQACEVLFVTELEEKASCGGDKFEVLVGTLSSREFVKRHKGSNRVSGILSHKLLHS